MFIAIHQGVYSEDFNPLYGHVRLLDLVERLSEDNYSPEEISIYKIENYNEGLFLKFIQVNKKEYTREVKDVLWDIPVGKR